jgi:hypothetical protein
MMRTPTHQLNSAAKPPVLSELSDEDLEQTDAHEDFWWRICLVVGCVLVLGAAWLS